MKQLLIAFLTTLPFSGFAHTATDTITNWQVYKDGKLVFKSHDFNRNIYVFSLDRKHKFDKIELRINSDVGSRETKRKLQFWLGEKLIYTSVSEVKPSRGTSLVLTKEQLIRAVGPDIGKTFTVKYVEGSGNDGRVVFQLVLN